MKIYVSRIPAEGLQEHISYEPGALDMERHDIHLDQPFEVDAFITKTESELVVQAQIHCSLRVTCARCLEEFASDVTTRGLYHYAVKPADIVDITDEVRQEIILAYPMVPVCRPDCKGLCMACGHKLNQGSCGHQP